MTDQDLESLEPYFFTEWNEKIRNANIFENENSETWELRGIIKKEKMLKIFDAIDLDDDLMSHKEILEFVSKHEANPVTYHHVVTDLMKYFMVEKKASISKIFDYESI